METGSPPPAPWMSRAGGVLIGISATLLNGNEWPDRLHDRDPDRHHPAIFDDGALAHRFSPGAVHCAGCCFWLWRRHSRMPFLSSLLPLLALGGLIVGYRGLLRCRLHLRPWRLRHGRGCRCGRLPRPSTLHWISPDWTVYVVPPRGRSEPAELISFRRLIGGYVGLGIRHSRHGQPAKVLQLLRCRPAPGIPSLISSWDGALITTALATCFWWFRCAKEARVWTGVSSARQQGRCDTRLIAGSATFGIGWGIAGSAQAAPFRRSALAGRQRDRIHWAMVICIVLARSFDGLRAQAGQGILDIAPGRPWRPG